MRRFVVSAGFTLRKGDDIIATVFSNVHSASCILATRFIYSRTYSMSTREERERAFVARMERYEQEHERNITDRLSKVRAREAALAGFPRSTRRKPRYPRGARFHEWPLHKHHVPQWNAQNGRCHWCCTDLKVTGYHIDHVFPRVRGGSDDPGNLKFACPTCNLSKCAKLPLDFVLSLFR